MINGLKLLRNTAWQEILSNWKRFEGSDPSWTKVALEMGWPDWESWRLNSTTPYEPEKRQWWLYEITDPNATVPNFLVGPWSAWQERLEPKNSLSFKEMIKNDLYPHRADDRILPIMKNYPEQALFFGFYIKGEGKIVLIEGHHRACAITNAKLAVQPLQFKQNPQIALTQLEPSERKILDLMLKRGTKKL